MRKSREGWREGGDGDDDNDGGGGDSGDALIVNNRSFQSSKLY